MIYFYIFIIVLIYYIKNKNFKIKNIILIKNIFKNNLINVRKYRIHGSGRTLICTDVERNEFPGISFLNGYFFFPHYARQVLDQKPQPGQNSLSVNYSSN